MPQPIEYQKLMTEIVHVNLPGPEEPSPGMSGGEILHGFLAELHEAENPMLKSYIDSLCLRECPLPKIKIMAGTTNTGG